MSFVGMASLAANIHLRREDPISLVHFVTNRCNARCSFCFIDFDEPTTFKNELSLSEIDRLTRSVGPHLQNVNLTGGEPFLRRDLLAIARLWFTNTSIRSIFISSNGSFPDRMVEFSRTLRQEFPSRKLIYSLSVDGPPPRHDEIRKIKGLFEDTMRSYHALRDIAGVTVNIAITVSHENCEEMEELFDLLTTQYQVKAITATIVRDEGVYKIPLEKKRCILEAYDKLTTRIALALKEGRLEGYDVSTLLGRLMNKKNVIVNRIIKQNYLEPRYVSPCHAGALFGIIAADGTVHACEILDRPVGNLRDYDLDFGRLWADEPARALRKWIRETRCHCTYECAWSFNVLANLRYQPSLIAAGLDHYW